MFDVTWSRDGRADRHVASVDGLELGRAVAEDVIAGDRVDTVEAKEDVAYGSARSVMCIQGSDASAAQSALAIAMSKYERGTV
jgi:hypothetical protein